MNFMYVCACVYTHTDLKLKFEVFYVTKLHVAHEEYRTGGLRINIQHLVIFNVCQILNTWAFLFLTYIKKYKKKISLSKLNSVSWVQQPNKLLWSSYSRSLYLVNLM